MKSNLYLFKLITLERLMTLLFGFVHEITSLQITSKSFFLFEAFSKDKRLLKQISAFFLFFSIATIFFAPWLYASQAIDPVPLNKSSQ